MIQSRTWSNLSLLVVSYILGLVISSYGTVLWLTVVDSCFFISGNSGQFCNDPIPL